jgi:hypothetical protein
LRYSSKPGLSLANSPPERLLGHRVRPPRRDGDADVIGEDLRVRVSVEVQPPGRRTVVAGIGGQDREGIAVLEMANWVDRRSPDLRPVLVKTRIGISPVRRNERRIRPPLMRIIAAWPSVSNGEVRCIQVRPRGDQRSGPVLDSDPSPSPDLAVAVGQVGKRGRPPDLVADLEHQGRHK